MESIIDYKGLDKLATIIADMQRLDSNLRSFPRCSLLSVHVNVYKVKKIFFNKVALL